MAAIIQPIEGADMLFESYDGCRNIGRRERPTYRGFFTKTSGVKSKYDLDTLERMIGKPPPGFCANDRLLALRAVEDIENGRSTCEHGWNEALTFTAFHGWQHEWEGDHTVLRAHFMLAAYPEPPCAAEEAVVIVKAGPSYRKNPPPVASRVFDLHWESTFEPGTFSINELCQISPGTLDRVGRQLLDQALKAYPR